MLIAPLFSKNSPIGRLVKYMDREHGYVSDISFSALKLKTLWQTMNYSAVSLYSDSLYLYWAIFSFFRRFPLHFLIF